MRAHTLLLLLISSPLSVQADTLYKCTDKQSESVLFTNHKVNGKQCTILSASPSGSNTERSAGSTRTRASATPTPADFPRVASDTQRDRDSNRRTILEQELANEQRQLEEARKANQAPKIQLHERNIVALQKELANLR